MSSLSDLRGTRGLGITSDSLFRAAATAAFELVALLRVGIRVVIVPPVTISPAVRDGYVEWTLHAEGQYRIPRNADGTAAGLSLCKAPTTAPTRLS